ncbi:hypothetical protein KIPB_001525, partial [Kipferlia bialata]|eukprot:g1525.t1
MSEGSESDAPMGIESIFQAQVSLADEGRGISAQREIGSSVFEARIKFQSVLDAMNRLPATKAHSVFTQNPKSAVSVAYKALADETAALVSETLALQGRVTETAHPGIPRPRAIPDDVEFEPSMQHLPFPSLSTFTRETLAHWDTATAPARRIKGTVVGQGAVEHLDYVLSDRPRLVGRTHRNRAAVKPIGLDIDPSIVTKADP